jgi:hypothetical protein
VARKQKTVIEVQCDRCTRTEERDGDLSKEVNLAAFEGRMFGLAVRFEDLCTPCLRTVKNHLEQIGKKLEGVSPDRVAKNPEEEVVSLVLPIPPGTNFGGTVSSGSNTKIKGE